MAIVQVDQPTQTYLPAFNKILFRVLSNQVLNVGFKYAVRIRNVKTNTIIATTYYLPSFDPAEPVEFDVSHFIQNDFNYYKSLFTNPSVSLNGNGWLRSDNLIIQFRVEIYEYYDANNDGVLEIDNNSLFTSNDFIAIPYSLNNYDRFFFDINDITNGGYIRPMTEWNEIKLSRNSFYNFAFLNPINLSGVSILNIGGIRIKQYGGNNNLLQTDDVPLTTIPNTPYELISHFHFRGSSILPNAKFVKLELYYLIVGFDFENEFATIYPIECERNTSKTLFFLNRYGAYDSYTFPLNNFTKKNLTKKTYDRFYQGYGYTNEDGIFRFRNTNPVYHSRINTTMSLQTNWLSDKESELLEQLFSSSSVYLLDNENTQLGGTFERGMVNQPVKLIPVNVKETLYEVKYTRAHRVFQYNIDIEFSEIEPRQIL